MTTSLRILRLHSQGHSKTEIARRMGISHQAVSYHLPGGKRGRPAVSDGARLRIREMADAGVSYRAIAEKVGVGIGTVHKYANEVQV